MSTIFPGLDVLTHPHPLVPYICIYASMNWVIIGSGNGLLHDGNKPLPEPMLTYNQ